MVNFILNDLEKGNMYIGRKKTSSLEYRDDIIIFKKLTKDISSYNWFGYRMNPGIYNLKFSI